MTNYKQGHVVKLDTDAKAVIIEDMGKTCRAMVQREAGGEWEQHMVDETKIKSMWHEKNASRIEVLRNMAAETKALMEAQRKTVEDAIERFDRALKETAIYED